MPTSQPASTFVDAVLPYLDHLKDFGWATLATIVFAVVLFALRKLDVLAEAAVLKITAGRGSPLRVQGLVLLSTEKLGRWVARGVGLLRRALALLVSLVYLNIVLGFFPTTARISKAFFAQLADAAWGVTSAVIDYLPKVASIVVIVVVVYLLLIVARRVFIAIHNGQVRIQGFYSDWAMPTYQLVRVLVVAFAAVVIFPYLPGAGSPAFQGVSIFLGLLLSLGSTSAVAHVIAGVVLVYMRPFSVGDRVRIADTLGDVVEKNLLSVRLRTPKNVELVLPNATVLAAKIENYSAAASAGRLLLSASVTIGYDVDWRKVHDLLLAAAAKTNEIVLTPKPFVWQTALNDFNVGYELNCATANARDMLFIESELRANVTDAFRDAGVEILSPVYASLRDGSKHTWPEK